MTKLIAILATTFAVTTLAAQAQAAPRYEPPDPCRACKGTHFLNPQPLPPIKFHNELNPQPLPPRRFPATGGIHRLNPQPLPPG